MFLRSQFIEVVLLDTNEVLGDTEQSAYIDWRRKTGYMFRPKEVGYDRA